MIAKPVISPDFTIEDIHKIREYHYELTKDRIAAKKVIEWRRVLKRKVLASM